MGRAKIEIKKIEDETNRQVTYTKRRNGLLKKAYELSILCDIDLALIAFSRSGRLTHFCSRKRVEDVLIRYLDCRDEENEQCNITKKEPLMQTLERLRREDDAFMELVKPENSDFCVVENLRGENSKLRDQLRMVETQLRAFEHDPLNFNSVQELKSRELLLVNILTRVTQRKQHLQEISSLSSCGPSSSFEGMPSLAQSEMIRFSNDANQDQQNYAQPLGENTPLMYDQLLLGSSSRTYDGDHYDENQRYEYEDYLQSI